MRRAALAAALGAALAAAAPASAHFASPVGVTAQTGPPTPQQVGDCGPGALPETGLQGQVPKADQDSGRSLQGYRCNLRLIGQQDIQSRGGNFQLGWYRDCAYVGLVGVDPWSNPDRDPAHPLNGFAVIDASNPASPRLVQVVHSDVGQSQHEAIEVNERRGMLVVQIGGLVAQWIEIYDVSKDCTKPEFKGRYDAGYPIFHGQKVSDDGMTVYATDSFNASGLGDILRIIDVSDMTRPRLIMGWNPSSESPPRAFASHDLELSADGTRAYLGTVSQSSIPGVFGNGGPTNAEGEPSVVVLDTTDIQQRKENPDLKVVGQASMPNFGHTLQRARIQGRPYLLHGGEAPFTGERPCPWAWGNVIDLGDERAPKAVAEIKLEVNDGSKCSQTGPDEAAYSIHYNGVDDEQDTNLAFYTYYTGGLRVFDVRNPEHPKEIAYFHTPPRPSTEFRPIPGNYGGDAQTPTWDSATSVVRYRPESGHIWFVSIGGGFQIAELTGKYGRPVATARLARVASRARRARATVTCSAACELDLSLRVAGRRVGMRRVALPEGGSASVSFRLRRGVARRGRRAVLSGSVRDATVDRVVGRVRTSRRVR